MLNVNIISLNMSKTKLIVFNPNIKHMGFDIKINLNQKRLYPTDSMKYLGVKINNKLNWKTYIDDIAVRLIRQILC